MTHPLDIFIEASEAERRRYLIEEWPYNMSPSYPFYVTEYPTGDIANEYYSCLTEFSTRADCERFIAIMSMRHAFMECFGLLDDNDALDCLRNICKR